MKLFKLKSLVLPLSVLLAVAVLFTACQPDDTDPGPTTPTNLSETLKTFPDMSTLVRALEVSNLTSQLDQAPVTLFAPTNAAFDDFLASRGLTSIDDPALDPVELKNILLNHVLDSYIFYADLPNGYTNTRATVEFDFVEYPVSMAIDVDGLSVNNSVGVKTVDIDGINGNIHTVDQVVTIPDVVELAAGGGNLNNFVQSLVIEDLENALQEEGPFTIFAPNDDAPWGAGIPTELEEILSDHIVAGNLRAEDLLHGDVLDSYGQEVPNMYEISISNGEIRLIEPGSEPASIIAKITLENIQGSNGVIHLIDNLIILL